MSQFTADQLALQAHIEAQNAAFVARCEAEGATAWCTTVSDPAHWASMDIFTIEQYERESLISYISDAHKDAYGFRPRGYNYSEWSMEDLQEEADRMSEAVSRAIEEERVRENQAIAAFEQSIENLISMGAGDRKTAIRWICDAVDHGGDLGYVCYELGLPYSMESELREVA
jgi:urocanate hydratase